MGLLVVLPADPAGATGRQQNRYARAYITYKDICVPLTRTRLTLRLDHSPSPAPDETRRQAHGRLTTHVLDRPRQAGNGIAVTVYRLDGERREVARSVTYDDGRCDKPLLEGAALEAGKYEIVFAAGDYSRALGQPARAACRDEVALRFGIADVAEHYHVPAGVAVVAIPPTAAAEPAFHLHTEPNREQREQTMEAYSCSTGPTCWLAGYLIAGIAWIGASFYFVVMLDNSLSRRRSRTTPEARRVRPAVGGGHRGGLTTARQWRCPKGEPLTQDLHWSKWEAYTTWLSGMA